MSKIIEHFLIPLFVIVSVVYAFNSFGADGIEMNKVYLHTTDNGAHIQRAKLSFYFSRDPQVQEIANQKSGANTSFFFPHAIIKKGECEEMVKRVNNYNNGYTITIEEVIKPTRGIQLVFNVDKEKFGITYSQFDSIGLHSGVVFELNDRDVLRRLGQAHNQPVLRTLWHTGKPRIAIDPGHGGIDGGAMGCGGIQEKNVCLAIGTALGDLLRSQGCDVLLTRNSDCTLLLDDRTAYANNHYADLFVSIHANYAANPKACGVETFCLQPHLLKSGFSQLSDAESSCVTDVFNQRCNMSHKLAQSVQRNLCDTIMPYHDESIDRHVKFSVAQVLLGTQMPSVLVEVGFVSHPKEAALLGSESYQNDVANGIYKGILAAMAS